MIPLPWVSVSMKACRSRVSAIACRTSGLPKGGASRLMMTLRNTLVGAMWQSSCPICLLTSFSIGTCRKYQEVMSTLPETKAKEPVATFLMIWYSMPSRNGRSFSSNRVADDLDVFVRLEFDEFELAGADRLLPHLRRRHVPG